jgi:hypothetical protein
LTRTYVNAELRRLVAVRADRICEYCLIHEDDTYVGCGMDHIVSEKHGGATTPENLAYACDVCNRNKGSDLGSLSLDGTLTRFFNPRVDHWADHFALDEDGVTIVARTEIGRVTERILKLNTEPRLLERLELRETSSYPPPLARRRMLSIV